MDRSAIDNEWSTKKLLLDLVPGTERYSVATLPGIPLANKEAVDE